MIRLLFVSLFCVCCFGGEVKAQSLSHLLDSCYQFLEKGDVASFNDNYVKILDAYEAEYNPEYYRLGKELAQMRVKDQSIRLLLLDAQKRDKPVSKIREIMKAIDRVNAHRVMEIIDQYGWLSPDDIGYEANEALFLCVQHAEDSIIQNKCLPILEEAVKEGNAEGWQYAFLTDRSLMNQGETQIYGTQRILRDGVYYLVPIQDIDRVDSLREALGLSLWKNTWRIPVLRRDGARIIIRIILGFMSLFLIPGIKRGRQNRKCLIIRPVLTCGKSCFGMSFTHTFV